MLLGILKSHCNEHKQLSSIVSYVHALHDVHPGSSFGKSVHGVIQSLFCASADERNERRRRLIIFCKVRDLYIV